MKMEIEDIYPLSPTQQGMLFHGIYAPESGMYVERLRYRIQGNLNIPAFKQAWQKVSERHPILRTAFMWEDVDEPLQVVLQRVELPLECHDWRGLSSEQREDQFQAHIKASRYCDFELSQAPLVRLTLIQMAEDVFEFIWSYHHLLLDGWSVSLVLGDLIQLYEAFCRGEAPQLEKRRPYRDYVAWLRQQDQSEAEAFWRQSLKGFTTPTPIAINGTPASVTTPSEKLETGLEEDYDVRHIHLPGETAEKLDAFARQHRLTLNTVMQGAWALLLSRYSGERDVVFGAVVSGRPADLMGAESMVGMFINTLPVRVRVSPGASLLSWLNELQAQQLDARRYEYNPLAKVQEWSEVQRGLPMFESIMVFENPTIGVRLGTQKESPEITYSIHYATVTGYPLTVVVEPTATEIALGITYDRRRFDAATVSRIQEHFGTLLAEMLENPDQPVSGLSLLTQAEKQQLIVEWNKTGTDFPQGCLHHFFEQQVQRSPDAVAVVFEDKQLSYQELNCLSNQLARHLEMLGIGPEARVAICMDRSLEMMVGMLGILKAGGVYVPLDPDYPKERLAFMLEDSQASALLTQRRVFDELFEERAAKGEERRAKSEKRDLALRSEPAPNGVEGLLSSRFQVVCLDTIWESLARESAENPANGVTADNPAYIIYTSGSTGRPKGVVVPHHAICNHMLWLQDHLSLNEADRYLQKTAFSFDASGTEFYAPLFSGGRLIMAQPEGHQDSAYLAGAIVEHGVTILQLVPSLLRVLLDEPEFGRCESLRSVICAGEALTSELQERFNASLDADLHNLYGPTEAAIDVTFWPHEHASGRQIVPIGRPLANTQIYLLDSDLQPVPVGVPGELYIGGDNLAQGYFNQPELTAEKFVPNPFIPPGPDGARLYRTGDLARYMTDGNIEYLGRIDYQVKVRGFRIELEEIEAVLSQHPTVKEGVVVVRDELSGHKRLVAYLVAADESSPSVSELRNFLKLKLPNYMVPSAFVKLEALPRTPSGKVDRRWLPAPDEARLGSDQGFVAPHTEVEKLLAKIWAQILGVKEVGVNDNFFELGGDSILTLQAVGKANQAGLHFNPKQLFQHPTIAELAAVVEMTPSVQAEQGLVAGPIPLTPIQNWFFEQNLEEPHHFNHALLLEVREDLSTLRQSSGQASLETGLDVSLLEKALHQVLVHHDALRIRFVRKESGWQQNNTAVADAVPLTRVDLSGLSEAEQGAAIEASATKLQASLNLSEGPLMQVAFYDLGEQKSSRLLIIIHHLLVDGVAWRILLDDLITCYQQLSSGQQVQLPSKTTSYKQWAQRLVEYARRSELSEELDYWLSEARTDVTGLPVDYPEGRDANTEAFSRTVSVSLSVEETQALLQEVPEAYHTQINDILLTALVQAFSQWTEVPRVLVDLEGHGRESIFEDVDLSRTVGWFTSIFPVLLELGRASDPGEALKFVKEQLRAVPNQGIGYGLLRYLNTDKEVVEKLRHLPQAEVSFNYLGQFDQILPESSPFAPASESCGPVHSPRGSRRYLLDVNGYISGGKLQLEWSYSEKIHRRATIERLAQDYLRALKKLIDHCQSTEAGGYTPSDFPLAKLEQLKLDKLVGTDRDVEDVYPLSAMQEAMLFQSLLAPKSGVYFTQVIYELTGLNISVLKQAWNKVVERHPILRTAFAWKNLDHPLQVVRCRVDLPIEEEDWRRLSAAEQKVKLQRYLKEDQSRGFQLSEAPLMRVVLFRLADERYQLVWSFHHLLLDGWSVPMLAKEFLSFYEAIDKGQDVHLQRRRPYRDYIEWLQHQNLSKAEAFWRRSLGGFTSPTSLGTNQIPASPDGSESGYSAHEIHLSEETTGALHSFTRKHQLTLNTLVQATWALLLSHYSGDDDVVYGATLSGRPPGLAGAESMIGLFINTLPVRVRVSGDELFLPWLKELQEQQAELRQYEYSPLSRVQGWSEVPQDTPLFESIVVFENFPMEGSHIVDGQGQGPTFVNTDFMIRNNFPFTVRAVPGSQLLLKVLYETSRFDAAAVKSILKRFEMLLHKVVTQPNVRLAELLETLAEVSREQRSMKAKEFKESGRQKLKNIRRKAMSGSKT